MGDSGCDSGQEAFRAGLRWEKNIYPSHICGYIFVYICTYIRIDTKDYKNNIIRNKNTYQYIHVAHEKNDVLVYI